MLIVTVDEFKKMIRNNDERIEEVDIVTTGTCGIMSGTLGIFHIPFNEIFKRAEKIFLDNIEGKVGVCPNEYLGKVDALFYGEVGFLFKRLVRGEELEAKAIADGKVYRNIVNIDELPTAKMLGTRMAFKNYMAFTNLGEPVKTIFHRFELKRGEATFSGCGEINPLENMVIKSEKDIIGKKALLNGAEALILGFGTRSSLERPNIMISADMKEMDSYYLGGFYTSGGIEIYNTVAIAVDVREHREALMKLDKDIALPLVNIFGREIIDKGKYSEVWEDVDLRPKVHVERCKNCKSCVSEISCPTEAIKRENGKIKISEDCFGCGVCKICPYNVFEIKLGSICGIPIVCRQSDRKRALDLAKELKRRLKDETKENRDY
ncbi:methanogenesis marker 16 metalloprotein [Methanocaldococcus infernus ME]|uniref:Methanogenesis marker 16 metalloprotein n=1 Tax=Methanocaldococcus infernus (strain DSM 11812 / JCM 15783 / ME) TaxID=573063 RepID=D5VTG0_METIM|nr:methanogenesis marker 16 metalloprotein [Methanocaldococcus infernus]ADG13863.1 methanogenesis marker 16 metalloprotein [Methanocaldococcus infernus ME]